MQAFPVPKENTMYLSYARVQRTAQASLCTITALLAIAAIQFVVNSMSLHAQVSALMCQVLSELAEGSGRQRAKLLLDAFKQTDERRRTQFAEVTL